MKKFKERKNFKKRLQLKAIHIHKCFFTLAKSHRITMRQKHRKKCLMWKREMLEITRMHFLDCKIKIVRWKRREGNKSVVFVKSYMTVKLKTKQEGRRKIL
jgi:hypothetical protein